MTVLLRVGKKLPSVPTFIKGESFAVIDPGNNGAVIGWNAHSRFPDHLPQLYAPVSADLVGVVGLARAIREWAGVLGIGTLVVESQFVGRNVDVALGTSFSAGVLVGHVMAEVEVTRVVLVKPATWQASLAKDDGPKKGAGKRRSLAFATEWFPDELAAIRTKARRQGFADAAGMANWYVGGLSS